MRLVKVAEGGRDWLRGIIEARDTRLETVKDTVVLFLCTIH